MTDRDEAEDRAFAARIRRAYLETPVPGAESRARIVAAVRAAGRPRRHLLAAWLAPRTFTVRPVAAFAAGIALVAAGALLARWLVSPPSTRPAGDTATTADVAATAETARSIRFVFVDPRATRVALVGDFNGWDVTATPLRPGPEAGTWSVDVPLPPGWHSYAFVIDGGQWRHDPHAPLAPPDDFGVPRSVVVVEGV